MSIEVDRTLIKTWTNTFSDYLSSEAVPSKGITRQFNADDIRVFAYVSTYWEDDPDIENIRSGLNSNDHYEYPYNELIIQATPLFRDPPEDLDETWKNVVLFGGMAEFGDRFELANSYKLAGDKLVEAAIDNEEPFELICPIIYNYRHATELYLKETIGATTKGHDLLLLLQKFKTLLKNEYRIEAPEWFENIILVFHEFDSNSTTFRYGGSIKTDEIFVDIKHVKILMGWLAESFKKIKDHKLVVI